jgi:hypothetical protein
MPRNTRHRSADAAFQTDTSMEHFVKTPCVIVPAAGPRNYTILEFGLCKGHQLEEGKDPVFSMTQRSQSACSSSYLSVNFHQS